jgi:hypothetical protein
MTTATPAPPRRHHEVPSTLAAWCGHRYYGGSPCSILTKGRCGCSNGQDHLVATFDTLQAAVNGRDGPIPHHPYPRGTQLQEQVVIDGHARASRARFRRLSMSE